MPKAVVVKTWSLESIPACRIRHETNGAVNWQLVLVGWSGFGSQFQDCERPLVG